MTLGGGGNDANAGFGAAFGVGCTAGFAVGGSVGLGGGGSGLVCCACVVRRGFLTLRGSQAARPKQRVKTHAAAPIRREQRTRVTAL